MLPFLAGATNVVKLATCSKIAVTIVFVEFFVYNLAALARLGSDW